MKKPTMNNLIEQINTKLNQSIQNSSLNTDLEESMMYSLQASDKKTVLLL